MVWPTSRQVFELEKRTSNNSDIDSNKEIVIDIEFSQIKIQRSRTLIGMVNTLNECIYICR